MKIVSDDLPIFHRRIVPLFFSTPQRRNDMQVARMHVYEVRPRKRKCGVDLISDVLPLGRLWYGEPNAVTNAVGYTAALQP